MEAEQTPASFSGSVRENHFAVKMTKVCFSEVTQESLSFYLIVFCFFSKNKKKSFCGLGSKQNRNENSSVLLLFVLSANVKNRPDKLAVAHLIAACLHVQTGGEDLWNPLSGAESDVCSEVGKTDEEDLRS